ncbi:WecB/TagA/CpsF family glycosyltransferase [Glaciecola sp. MF2-115]|uniref:WecB/TagA/CpsF family glycosyltransferase n=1 Tax=Glaciecola sp. MF2-115 TaxID=3384827 RepID=UPI00399F95EA
MKLEEVTFTNVGGLKTACIDRRQLVELIVNASKKYKTNESQKNPLIIFDINGHAISLANSSPIFKQSLSQANIIHADGQSVVVMSKLTDGPSIPERSATTDTIHDIPSMCSQKLTHFLFGGSKRIVEECAVILSQKYSNFQIAGTQNGYFTAKQEEKIIKTINNSKADILWVGLGKPTEQRWVIDNKHRLNVAVIITCGGCYNYVTGDYARAPLWMQNIGIEWLHRVVLEPRKLFWRYVITIPHSIYCVLKHKFIKSHDEN